MSYMLTNQNHYDSSSVKHERARDTNEKIKVIQAAADVGIVKELCFSVVVIKKKKGFAEKRQ